MAAWHTAPNAPEPKLWDRSRFWLADDVTEAVLAADVFEPPAAATASPPPPRSFPRPILNF